MTLTDQFNQLRAAVTAANALMRVHEVNILGYKEKNVMLDFLAAVSASQDVATDLPAIAATAAGEEFLIRHNDEILGWIRRQVDTAQSNLDLFVRENAEALAALGLVINR